VCSKKQAKLFTPVSAISVRFLSFCTVVFTPLIALSPVKFLSLLRAARMIKEKTKNFRIADQMSGFRGSEAGNQESEKKEPR
jgi:hypothetical protein